MKKVIIAEKPSVARNIADAIEMKVRRDGYLEGEDFIVTWVFGHLLQLFDTVDYDASMTSWKMEYFPFFPEEYKYKVKSKSGDRKSIDQGAKKQLEIIKGLINREDVDEIISATDWDREGQVIADEIFMYLEVQKPIKRLLLNEWTKDEVKNGLANLKDNTSLTSMHDAGFGRQIADWLIGINLTSVATLKYRNTGQNKLLNIGRVLFPTLNVIYTRDIEIDKFVSTKYYKLTVAFEKDGIRFNALYKEDNSEKFNDREYLEAFADILKEKECQVSLKEVDRKNERPPLLFNLSGLQGHITSKNKGFSSDKVLKIAQGLYEKKLITYPRTASNVLDESLIDKTKKVLNNVSAGLPFKDEIKFKTSKRIFDSKKVESHSAIIPTYEKPRGLSKDESIVYETIRNRFVAQFMPDAISEETKLELEILDKDIKGILSAKGKVQIQEGFRKAERITSKDTELPSVDKKEILKIIDAFSGEVVKKPPKHHTEKTLLKIMETCGKSFEGEDSEEMMMAIMSGFSIGTPATRAETIKKLLNVGYVEMQRKSLVCTDLGREMVETFPVKSLFDLEYTGKLEKTLSDIERGKFEQREFLDMISNFVEDSVNRIKTDKEFASKVIVPKDANVVGLCPECGNPIVETDKAFGCSNWKNGCTYTIWKDDKYISSFHKKVSEDMVRLLLKNGRVGFHGLISKKGNKFSAYFRYEKDSKRNTYSWKMDFIDRNK